MSADEVYGLGRDAGERLVALALILAPCYARLPYTALLPICRPQTHYCRLVYPHPAGPWLWPGASGNGLSNPQTVIYKGGPAT